MTYPVHPAAEAFPMLGEDELNRLAIDILQNGLREPLTLTPAGELLDGRNRLAACKLVNVDPEVIVYDGDPWSYSRSKNLDRRHMTTGQRAASCAISLIGEGKRRNGRWVRGSVPSDPTDDQEGRTLGSQSTSTWPVAMSQAGFVADWSDDGDLITSVMQGTTALDAAYKNAQARQQKQAFEEEQERKRREREIAADDAVLARILSLCHNILNEDHTAALRAQDPDNWHGVRNLIPKVTAALAKLERHANGLDN
jgi:hypothetical protein